MLYAITCEIVKLQEHRHFTAGQDLRAAVEASEGPGAGAESGWDRPARVVLIPEKGKPRDLQALQH